VRDKEVKSIPLGESTQDPESVESWRSRTRAVELSYPNEDGNLDEEPGMSEVCLPLSILFIPTMLPTSRTKLTRALSHLLLVAAVVQILFAPSSGARMYFTIARRGRCANLIGRKIAWTGGATNLVVILMSLTIWTKNKIVKSKNILPWPSIWSPIVIRPT
jgi:hypothetical protein